MSGARCLILFDSDKDAAAQFASILPSGSRVFHCRSLQDVYETFREHVVDAVFLDMPAVEESSVDILTELERRCRHVVKILTTSHYHVEISDLTASDNVFAVLRKPFDPLETRKVLQGALRIRDLTRELESVRTHLAKDERSGLNNMFYLHERINAEYKRAQRYYYPLSLSVFDVYSVSSKKRESLNRSQYLKVTAYLKKLVRDNDVLVQDETGCYYLLLPDTRKKGAEILMGRLASGLQKELSPEVFSGAEVRLQVHAGFVSFPEDGIREEKALMQLAQHALDHARKGRGLSNVFSFRGMDITGLTPLRTL